MRPFERKKITIDVVEQLSVGGTVMDVDEPGFGVRRQGKKPIFFVLHRLGWPPSFPDPRRARHRRPHGEKGTRESQGNGRRHPRWPVAGGASRPRSHHADRRRTRRGVAEVSRGREAQSSTARNYRANLKSTILPYSVASGSTSHRRPCRPHASRGPGAPYADQPCARHRLEDDGLRRAQGLRPRGLEPCSRANGSGRASENGSCCGTSCSGSGGPLPTHPSPPGTRHLRSPPSPCW